MGEKPDFDRIKDRAQDVRKDVNALALETVEALRKAVDELTVIASVNAVGTRDFGNAKLEEFSASIRRSPISFVAAGFGLGLIIGLWRQRDVRQ